ncbi:MAG: hypothetical protein IH946_09620, partial [Bacteroidetes bacterium]|nr:hypothetical protein [Bacteroidota bacterium]
KDDFTYSEPVTATASETRILMIDWERLFTKKSGSVDKDGGGAVDAGIIGSIPIFGPLIGGALGTPAVGYAFYKMMKSNPDWDVVFYPKMEVKVVRP